MPTPGPQVYDEDTATMVYGPAIANVGATYTATEQAAINAILAALRAAGIIALD